VTIVLVEQNTRAALALADRAYVLVQGRNRHEGRARDLAGDRQIAALYLGGVGAEGAA
jgi:branched-chain amino acid transport system ATP-binding protein